MRFAVILCATLFSMALAASAGAATLIRVAEDGSASVRVADAEAVLIPARCVRELDAGLLGQSEPAAVEALVTRVVRDCAATDDALAGAIAAYALSLVSPDLAPSVIVGAQAGNPNASDEIDTAAGPIVPSGPAALVGSLTPLGSLRGVGGDGTQELPRSGSATTF